MAISNGSNQESAFPEVVYSEAGLSETEIVKQAMAGDADAFGKLYQRHQDAIFRYVRHRVTETDEAENLTQTVFVKAWQGIARYQPTKTPFRAWLYRIAGNTVIDYYRTHKETADIESQWRLVDEQVSPEDALLLAERSEAVRSAITQLKPSYQQVLSLRFLDERDYPETAHALDRQVNAVRVLQHRALGALQKVLTQEQVSWIVTVAAVLTLALGGSVVLAAQGSLPGDTLYPLKRAAESSLLRVADDSLDVQLQRTFADRRIGEMANLLAAGRHDQLAALSQDYAQHLSGMVTSLSLLAARDPDEASRQADSAVLALIAQSERLSGLASSMDGTQMPALQSSIDAVRQAQSTIDSMAPPPLPVPIPDTDQSDSASGGTEPDTVDPAPIEPGHAPIADTDPPQEVSAPTPAPPSSNARHPIDKQSPAHAEFRSEASAGVTAYGLANPTREPDLTEPLNAQGQNRVRANPSRTDQVTHDQGAANVSTLPLAWPFPTLRPALHHPAAPLGSPQVLPHRDQHVGPQSSSGIGDVGQSDAEQPQQSKPQPVGAKSPDAEKPVPGSGAKETEQEDHAPASSPQGNENSHSSDSQSGAENDHQGGQVDDQSDSQPADQREDHREESSDSSGGTDNGQHGSSSSPGSEPSDSGDEHGGENASSSGTSQQEDSSSSSKGQGR